MKDKIKFIKEIAANMNENKIDKIKYEDNNFEIEINKKHKKKISSVLNYSPMGNPAFNVSKQEILDKTEGNVGSDSVESDLKVESEIQGTKIESPMVGTFYTSPSPNAEPFVKVGDIVTEGQTLCIVEAMKLMNEVKSSVSGKVVKIMAKNGDIIKKGQVLVVIE